MLMETKDLILKKAVYEDWKSIYHNVWSRPDTAKYMQWKVTTDEEGARERIQKTIAWQENHDAWLVYEKKSGQAIGFTGIVETRPHIYEETGIWETDSAVADGVLHLFGRDGISLFNVVRQSCI